MPRLGESVLQDRKCWSWRNKGGMRKGSIGVVKRKFWLLPEDGSGLAYQKGSIQKQPKNRENKKHYITSGTKYVKPRGVFQRERARTRLNKNVSR